MALPGLYKSSCSLPFQISGLPAERRSSVERGRPARRTLLLACTPAVASGRRCQVDFRGFPGGCRVSLSAVDDVGDGDVVCSARRDDLVNDVAWRGLAIWSDGAPT